MINKKYMIKVKAMFALLISTSIIVSCVNKDEFFELKDRGGVGPDLWSTEGTIQLHLNRAYDVVMPQFLFQDHTTSNMQGRYGIHFASDESFFPNADSWAARALGMGEPLDNHSVFFTGNLYTGNAGGNKYFDIARCNNAIKYIPEGTLPRSVYRQYLGQYYALRAMVYFELTKVYGGVPLVLEPQSPDYMTVTGRASAKECFKTIVRDLDSAMVLLDGITFPDATGRGKITKAAAASLKAKALLYWASPQFNPRNDPKHPYEQERWNVALQANKEAYDICIAAGNRLHSNYATLFQTEGTANPEVILVRPYSSSIERRGHDAERRSRPSSEGGSPNQGYRATINLMDAYPMKDGNRISTTGAYTYDPVMFWQNRDPRFTATFAYNGSVWPLSGKTTRRQWTYVNAAQESAGWGVYCKRFSTASLAAGSVPYTSNLGGNGMDWIEMRFAEVMLNYAECLNETGNLALAKDLVRQIRIRAGIEQGAAGNDYGLGAATSVDAMRDLIFNERFIEFAFENKRNADLRRMRRMHLLTGTMSAMTIETQTSGTRATLEAVVNPTTGQMFRDNLNIEDKATYLTYFKPYSIVQPISRPYSVPEFHYFYTFHNDFVYSGVNIQPTIGWAGGTFDPLD